MRRKISPDEPVSELRAIPIRDNGEPLIDFMELSERLYWQPTHPVYEYQRFRLARETVARMLARAAEHAPAPLRLAVVEGWRPPAIQRAMHEATRERLRREHPEWTDAQLASAAEQRSAPMDEQAPPPHTTGGAVDVHLVDADGQVLDFQRPYDILDSRGAPFDAPGLAPEARRNRELLRDVMTAAGFTNYPAEWWHWSYGDQGWAYRGGHPFALYGAIQPPKLDHADFSLRPKARPGF